MVVLQFFQYIINCQMTPSSVENSTIRANIIYLLIRALQKEVAWFDICR